MKKAIIISGLVLVVLLASAVLVPVLFREPLLEKIKTEINKKLNANVGFTDFNLSLFKGFPKVQAELTGLTITGKEQFQNDTLLSVQSVSTNLSLADLFNTDNLKISSVKVTGARVYLLSTLDGLANWDIALADEETAPGDTTEPATTLSLQSIEVRNLNLVYHDEASTTRVELKNTSLDASGEVDGSVTRFKLKGDVGELVFEYDSVRYLAQTVLKAESELTADYNNMSFVFGNSKLYLNELPLDVSGRIEMPSDSLYFDLNLKQPQSDFKTLLALVPPSYQNYLKGVSATGEAGFESTVKGWFYNDSYPEISSRVYIRNAAMQYEGLPEKIANIGLEAAITKPQGNLDSLKVQVSEAHAEIRQNPIDLRLLVTTPISDPAFDAAVSGKIDLASLASAIPMDSVELRGTAQGNLTLKGPLSAVDAQDFDRIGCNGHFVLNGIRVKTARLTKPVDLSSGTVTISTREIAVQSLAAKTGESDFNLNGKLTNYLPYFLKNKTLQGNFSLQSGYINFNELATLMAADSTAITAPGDSLVAFRVPGNLDLTFGSHIGKAVFDRLNIENIDGLIVVKNKILQLQKLGMNLLDGELTLDGNYTCSESNQPDFDFNVQIRSFEIPQTFQSFSAMKRYAPIAAKSTGKLSSKIRLKGKLDKTMSIIPASLSGSGLLNTQNLRIVDSPTFNEVRNFIKSEKLKLVTVDDFTSNFKIENGNLLVSPFSTRIADQDVTVSGQVLVDRTVALDLAFRVNKDDLKDDIVKGLNFLPGSENISKLDVGVAVKGDLASPKVSVDLSKAKDQIAAEVKKSSKEQLQKSVKKIGDELKKLFK